MLGEEDWAWLIGELVVLQHPSNAALARRSLRFTLALDSYSALIGWSSFLRLECCFADIFALPMQSCQLARVVW